MLIIPTFLIIPTAFWVCIFSHVSKLSSDAWGFLWEGTGVGMSGIIHCPLLWWRQLLERTCFLHHTFCTRSSKHKTVPHFKVFSQRTMACWWHLPFEFLLDISPDGHLGGQNLRLEEGRNHKGGRLLCTKLSRCHHSTPVTTKVSHKDPERWLLYLQFSDNKMVTKKS